MGEISLAGFLWVIFLSLFAGFYAVKVQIPAIINSRSLQSLQSTGNQQISVENLLILWVQNCKVFCKFDENFAKNEREITRSTTEKFVSSNFN